jgi:hypothetical protein
MTAHGSTSFDNDERLDSPSGSASVSDSLQKSSLGTEKYNLVLL